MDDPDFSYNVIRPVAVVSGYLIAMSLGYNLREWWIRRREKRRRLARNVTP